MAELSSVLDGLWLAEATQADIRMVQDVLDRDEELLFVGRGHVLRGGVPAVRRWTIAISSDRLLCIKEGGVGARTVIGVERREIHDISAVRSLGGWQLIVSGGRHRLRLQMAREHLTAMHRLLMGGMVHHPTPAASAAPARVRPAIAGNTRASTGPGAGDRIEYLENSVERLETEVERLQQQVDFMEEMLRTPRPSRTPRPPRPPAP